MRPAHPPGLRGTEPAARPRVPALPAQSTALAAHAHSVSLPRAGTRLPDPGDTHEHFAINQKSLFFINDLARLGNNAKLTIFHK